MSLVHADNFSIYGSNAQGGVANALDGVYASIQSTGGGSTGFVTDPDGVSGGLVLNLSGSGASCRYVLQNPTEKVGVAQRVWLEILPTLSGQIASPVQWRDASNDTIAYIMITTTGAIRAYVRNAANSAFDLVGDTVVPVVTAAGWYHIEAAFEASTVAVGTMEVRVEGVTVLDVENIDTYTGTVFQLAQSTSTQAGGAPAMHFKDYVVWDSDGSLNNDFVGSVIVAELTPNSDVTAGGWTSTGANIYGVLDNLPPSDAAYISASDAPPAPCEVGLTNLPPDITSVRGLVTYVRAAKVDGGDGQLQIGLRSGAALGNGTDRPITAAQIYWRDVFEEDPNTNAPWTPGAVDAATMVIDRTV